MALSTTAIDTNRTSNSISLPTELSQDVWAKTIEESAIMRLATRIDLPGRGLSIPTVTGEPSADWVGESAEKPVSKHTFALKTMKPYKIACIELFSNEFRRDLPALYNELAARLPKSIGQKVDNTIFQGTTPGTGFDVLTSATAVNISPDAATQSAAAVTTWEKLVTVMETLAAEGYDLDGFALSPQARAFLLKQMDGTGRPLFVPDVHTANIGNLLGMPAINAKQAYKAGSASADTLIGFAGEWSQARYGIVEDIEIAISDQATVNDGTNQVNLWQRNMFAVRVEAEIGFVVSDDDAFVRLTMDYSA